MILKGGALIALAAAGLTAWHQDAPLQAAPRNPGFEDFEAGAPAGWTFRNRDPGVDLRVESVPGEAGNAARVYLASGEAAKAGGSLFQLVDAAPYRGKLVRLRARLHVARPGSHVGLGLAVVRPEPKPAGYRYGMDEVQVPAGGWTDYAITGRVAREATQIRIAFDVAGDADAAIDELSLEAVEPDPAPPSPEAREYLDKAIALIRAHHIDSAKADWPRITADARAEIGGAKTPRDTYNAIRGILGALGEKHSFMILPTPEPAPAAPGAKPAARPAPPLPHWKLVDGRVGEVWLPYLNGGDGQEHSKLYTATLREGLLTMDRQAKCGWIVDLRANGGGNMWPMLQGLDPLLGSAPFGFFVDTGSQTQPWRRKDGQVVPADGPVGHERPSFALTYAGAPVAVLVGPRTGSSGEMTAIALIGRKNVRVFGRASAGYTTANEGFPMPDGMGLVLSVGFVRDRTGRDYQATIAPDTLTDDAERDAVKWLSEACAA